MKILYKRLKNVGLIVTMITILGLRNSAALVPLPVFDGPDLAQKAMQTLQETLMSELESYGNQILSKKLTDLGFGEMAGEVFGPVLGPMLANNPYLQQLQNSLGDLEDMAKNTAKEAGQCVIDAKKARTEAIKEFKKKCKENNPEDEVEEKKCIEDAKDLVKKIEKDALATCKAELNKKTAEISAAAKQQAKEMGESMKKDYNNVKSKANAIKDDVKEKANAVKDNVKEKASAVKDNVKEKAGTAKETVQNSFSWKKKDKNTDASNNNENTNTDNSANTAGSTASTADDSAADEGMYVGGNKCKINGKKTRCSDGIYETTDGKSMYCLGGKCVEMEGN